VSRRRSRILVVCLVLAALAVMVAACGGGGDDDEGAVATTAPATTTASADRAWHRVVPGGDCQCSDGSEFSFWVREANPAKVVFYLQDGGVCFSAETCAESDLYKTSVEGPTEERGMFDFADPRNPFADYSVVYVPYCTGDVHIGKVTREYGPALTVQHKGYVNGTAAFDHLVATFPRATEVVVIGESAGSIAAPLYAGLVSDRLPDARITVLAHGSGSYADVPRVNDIIAAWGGPTGEASSPPEFFIQSGRHDPEIAFARIDYAYDEEQESKAELLGIPAKSLLAQIESVETQIEDAGVNVHSYIAPGDQHVVFSDGPFYTETVNGEKLVDWVSRLIKGEPVDDVHCQNCRDG
jgi:hypothetical protein